MDLAKYYILMWLSLLILGL